MNLDSFTGPGSTPSRRKFWDKITQAVNASQKVAGRNVSVSEHQGKGTLINVTRERPVTPPPTGCPATITFSGVEFCCACDPSAGRVQFFEEDLGGGLGLMNGIDFPISETTCIDESQLCFNDSNLLLQDHIRGDEVCPDEGSDLNSENFSIFVKIVSGIWHVAVWESFGNRFILFYGTGSDPSSISNTITDCTLTSGEFDNAITECLTGTSITSCSAAKNGTATLNF